MSSDLFFSQPIPQNPSTGVQSDQTGPSGIDRSARIRTTGKRSQGDANSFLTTLKQVSQGASPAKTAPPSGKARLPENTGSNGNDEIDQNLGPGATNTFDINLRMGSSLSANHSWQYTTINFTGTQT